MVPKQLHQTATAEKAVFHATNTNIAKLTMLAHPAPDARTSFTTDASATAVAAV